MVRHAEKKQVFKIPRTSTDENCLASGHSILSILIFLFINRCTTNSSSAAHRVPYLKTVISLMLIYNWCFGPVQPEPRFNPPTLSFWQDSIISQWMNASLIACFLFFSKTTSINRGKEKPSGMQMPLPFRHQRHCNCDYKTCCHDESYITAGKLPGCFFVGFAASHASRHPKMNNRPGATFLLGGGD
jgi:hypothetical protein